MEEHIHYHDPNHSHTHTSSISSKEEALALLAYMVNHNKHHAEELHEIAHSIHDEQAHDLIHHALDSYTSGNEKLEQALKLLRGE